MSYAVRTSRRADADVAIIFDWIAKRSINGAGRWLDAFEAAVRKLETQANQCVAAPESDELEIDLRQFMFRTRRCHPYRILFVIRDDTVHLAAVRGAGQKNVSIDDVELPD